MSGWQTVSRAADVVEPVGDCREMVRAEARAEAALAEAVERPPSTREAKVLHHP